MATTLADRIQQAIATSGLSQNEVERQMGKSKGYLSKLVKRDGNPRADSFKAFAEITRVRVPWLLEGQMPMRATDPEETDSPEMVEFLKSEEAATYSEEAIASVRMFASRSSRRMSGADIAFMARTIEAAGRVLEGDPIEEERARRRGGKK